jgi:acetyl-CoA C-acetyltransferase
MAIDPRTPVVVGTGQFLNRVDEGAEPLEPVDLILEAIRLAEEDAGTSLAARADVVAVPLILSWKYRDPGRILADALGATSARTWYPPMGGNTPQMMLNRLAGQMADGDLDAAILCGGESWNTRAKVMRSGEVLHWRKQGDDVVADWGSDESFILGHPFEQARAVVLPVQSYPLFETAMLHSGGRGVDGHLQMVGEMWAGFSRVAADNPYAWRRQAYTAEEITTPTPENRYVGWPYTKRMVSNPDVDMASAVVMCTVERAEAAGIPRERWVFPHTGTDGRDRVMSERLAFDASPSIGIAGRRALELAGVGIEDVAHLDVYSCFPSAVGLFCRELAVDPVSRPLTVYGGLCFAGGPWNNPVGHAIASMVEVLRKDPGSLGLVTANGGNVDKHAFGLFGTEPPRGGFRHEHPQEEIDAVEGRPVIESFEGPVTIETWTVMHDRESTPERYHGTCLTPDGSRVWATSQDPDLFEAAVTEDLGGRAATLDADGTLHLTD